MDGIILQLAPRLKGDPFKGYALPDRYATSSPSIPLIGLIALPAQNIPRGLP